MKETNSGLSKKLLTIYAVQNPNKFKTKFGHLDLSVIEDENQKFQNVQDMEKFIAFVKEQANPASAETEETL